MAAGPGVEAAQLLLGVEDDGCGRHGGLAVEAGKEPREGGGRGRGLTARVARGRRSSSGSGAHQRGAGDGKGATTSRRTARTRELLSLARGGERVGGKGIEAQMASGGSREQP